MNSQPTPNCAICGSPLIKKEQTVSQIGISAPMTVTKYLCSDPGCQAEIDKKVVEAQEKKKAFEKARAEKLAAKANLTSKPS